MCASRNMSKSEMLVKVERARKLINRYRGQARFLRLTSGDGRPNGWRRPCVQCAWNERRNLRNLRNWLKESGMTDIHA